MPALKYWDGSAWQYVGGGTPLPANPTGQLIDYRVLPTSLNLGTGAQFISGFYVILPTPNRKYLIHEWLTIGAPGPGDAGVDLSIQMGSAPAQESPTAAAIIRAGTYITIAAQWQVWPTAAGLPTPNTVNGWINCNPITVYRGIIHATDVGST